MTPRASGTTLGDVNDTKTRLVALINDLAVIHGAVTLASGKQASYYVDMRRVTLHHEAAPLIGHLLLDLLEEEGYGVSEIDAIGGLTMGADPVATSVQYAANSRGLDLDAFLVRKESKGHGLRRQVEGPEISGRRVVVVEDTSTTGGSALIAARAAEAAGATVVAVACVVDRNTGAREAIAEAGYPYLWLLDRDDLGLPVQ